MTPACGDETGRGRVELPDRGRVLEDEAPHRPGRQSREDECCRGAERVPEDGGSAEIERPNDGSDIRHQVLEAAAARWCVRSPVAPRVGYLTRSKSGASASSISAQHPE